MRAVTSVGIIFENTEYVDNIDTRYIGRLNIVHKTTDIARVDAMTIIEINTCDTFVLELFKEVNDCEDVIKCDLGTYSITDRIAGLNNISSILLHYDDNTEEQIYVPWAELPEDEGRNIDQQTYISKDGNLYVFITEGDKFDMFFNKEEIDHLDFNKCEGYGFYF